MIPVESKLRVRGFWGRYTREKRLRELSELSEEIRLKLRREAEAIKDLAIKDLKKSHRRLIIDVRSKMY